MVGLEPGVYGVVTEAMLRLGYDPDIETLVEALNETRGDFFYHPAYVVNALYNEATMVPFFFSDLRKALDLSNEEHDLVVHTWLAFGRAKR